jgi:hypothetical protein
MGIHLLTITKTMLQAMAQYLLGLFINTLEFQEYCNL